MSPRFFLPLAFAAIGFAETQKAPAAPPVENLGGVRRVFVAPLVGGASADALRELIIASLDGARLFVLTENPENADAVLKGAAEDRAFTDTFDYDDSVNESMNLGVGSLRSSSKTRSGGVYGGSSASEREGRHIKELKHEAYASVRLCNRAGDVLWSTTQESKGAKFRNASADVASKIARQLTTDFDRQRQPAPSVLKH